MFRNLAGPELLILLVIVILIFGVGRITKIASELGGGIRAFRKGLSGEDDVEAADEESEETKQE
jgi:sec-independent protein translocase protein TatA